MPFYLDYVQRKPIIMPFYLDCVQRKLIIMSVYLDCVQRKPIIMPFYLDCVQRKLIIMPVYLDCVQRKPIIVPFYLDCVQRKPGQGLLRGVPVSPWRYRPPGNTRNPIQTILINLFYHCKWDNFGFDQGYILCILIISSIPPPFFESIFSPDE